MEFDTRPEQLLALPWPFMPIQVRYHEDIPYFNFYKCQALDYVLYLFGTKGKAWQHEDEWRIVLQDNAGPISIPPTMIRSVILGLRTEKQSEHKIRDWIQKRSVPTTVLRIGHKEHSFELELVQ